MELIHEAQRVVTHVAECLVRKCSDVLPAYENAPAVGHIQASQNVQQGRLARTGCADDGEYLAGDAANVTPERTSMECPVPSEKRLQTA